MCVCSNFKHKEMWIHYAVYGNISKCHVECEFNMISFFPLNYLLDQLLVFVLNILKHFLFLKKGIADMLVIFAHPVQLEMFHFLFSVFCSCSLGIKPEALSDISQLMVV